MDDQYTSVESNNNGVSPTSIRYKSIKIWTIHTSTGFGLVDPWQCRSKALAIKAHQDAVGSRSKCHID